MTTQPCNNCGSTTWAAWNEDYCTDCEREWYKIAQQVIRFDRSENPLQEYVDSILQGVEDGTLPLISYSDSDWKAKGNSYDQTGS